jgi:hypothetical protein
LGVIHRPDDILNRRRRVEVATRDLNPGVRDLVVKIVDSWSGVKSAEDLKKLVGEDKAKQIMMELGLPEE